MRKMTLRLLAFAGTLSIASSGYAEILTDCTLSADAILSTGEVFRGTASDLDGSEFADLVYDKPTFTFEIVGDPEGDSGGGNGVICRLNGDVTADISGTSGILNGEPGFPYVIELIDNREQPAQVGGVLFDKPRDFIEGSLAFEAPTLVTIPGILTTIEGAAGSGLALLNLGSIRCTYRGDTIDYAFEWCAGVDGRDFFPGDTLNITEASLRLISADRAFPVTLAIANLDPAGFVPDPDEFFVEVYDPVDGTPIESFSGIVVIGDMDIVPVP